MHADEHRRGLTRRVVAAATALVVVAAVACALWWSRRPPQVAPAPQAGSAACRAAVAAFPDRLGVLGREATDTVGAARYGDPAVVVRCGMPAPAPTADECIDVSGVDWVVHPLTDGTRLTTYGREPALEVLVPAAHSPAPLLLPPLGDAARRLPSTGHACIG